MLFVVHALDHVDALPRRLAHYDAHKAYLAGGAVSTIISGPLVADDGDTMIGSLFIFEAASRAAVERFNREDPFHIANVWKTISISAFQLRVDRRG